jgi:TonB-linked SusC/RagA family outer membrane protein
MKLTCILLITLLLHIHLNGHSQAITWSGRDVSVKKVFDVIRKQTEFTFFYNVGVLKNAHKVSVNARNATLKEVMEQCSKGQPFDYDIENKIIVITKRVARVEQAVKPVIDNKDMMRRVSGKVSNSKGEPLADATVSVAGTYFGTATLADGAFAIRVPNNKDELILSSIGYEETSVIISKLPAIRDIVIVMKEKDRIEAGDVVVIGYGIARKVDLTGSLSVVNIKDIGDRQNPDLPTLLQGKISGVDVNSGSIRVRGVTSFNNTDPLVVIDGFLGGSMETVNPNDIQNIEVLKDASSTAIYGSRGANGVILITTKKPKAGPTKISLNLNSGFATTPKKLSVLNASQYIDYVQEGLRNAGLSITDKLLTPGVRIDATNWQDAVFKTSHSNSVDLNLSGGSPSATFYVSMGYKHADEIYIGPGHDIISARLKNDFIVKKWLRFGDNVSFNYRIDKGVGPSLASSIISMQPYYPVRDTNNYWGYSTINRLTDLGDAINPVESSALTHPLTHNLSYQANMWAEIQPFRGLTYHFQTGVTGSFNRNNIWTDKYDNSSQQTVDATFTDNSAYTLSPIIESYLTYTHKSGKHDVTAMVGNTWQNYASSGSISVYGQNYANTSVRSVFNAENRSIAGETFGRYAFASYFGRFNYQYNNRYLLTVNLRRDGSPRFAPQYRWGTFPSVAFAWKLHEEDFIKMLNIFAQLKVRASWGISGNDAIGDFRYLSQIYTNGEYYPFGMSPVPVSGATVVNDASANIKWESTTSRTLGVDMSFLRNAVNFTAEYFLKNSNDILFPVPRPESLGYGIGTTGGDAIVNAASCVNKGIELQLGFRNSIGQIQYYIDANYTYVKNNVTSLGTGQPYMDDISRTDINHPIGYFYGYTADGIFKTRAELDEVNQKARAAALKVNPQLTPDQVAQVFYQLPSTSPGDVRYKDINGDGHISDNYDRSLIGNSIPTHLYGFTVQMGYKKFDFNIFLHGIGGSQIYYTAYEHSRSMKAIENQEIYTLNRWKSEQDPGNGIVPRAIIGDPALNSRPSTLMVSSGNYFKLRQVSVGYSLSDNLMKKAGFNKFRIYASGSDLLTFTKFQAYDPEFGGTNLRRGVNYLNYPMPRSFSIGLQVGL